MKLSKPNKQQNHDINNELKNSFINAKNENVF